MEKVAVYTGTRGIYADMLTAAKSLIVNSDVDKIYFLIEDDVFPFALPEVVEAINVSDQRFFRWDGPNMNTPYSYMALMRAALPFVFTELDVILSLDVDTIVDKEISEIWDINLDGYYFAASHEWHRTHNGFIYTNAGVTLFNLKKLRDEGKANEVVYVLNNSYFRWVDQDVLNYLCQGRIYDLSSDYNDNDWTVRPNERKIIHFAGIKHWNHLPIVEKYRQMVVK